MPVSYSSSYSSSSSALSPGSAPSAPPALPTAPAPPCFVSDYEPCSTRTEVGVFLAIVAFVCRLSLMFQRERV
eukprot:4589086-Prymnesium_polylepis.1